MNEDGAAPDAAAQLAGLIFAALLVDDGGRIAAANPAAEEMLGRSAPRLLGEGVTSAVEIDNNRVRDGLANGDVRLVARGVYLCSLQGRRRINLTCSPLATHPGWRVVTLSDAGQVDGETEEDTKSELRAPAILAHEIKNPLSAIRGASQLLARRVSERDKPLAKMIGGEVDRIAQLIDRMQQLGSRPVPVIGSCNLHEAIRNAMATVRAGRSDAVDMIEEFDPSLPPVAADQGALEQVLINLIANAADACADSDDCRVQVRTRYASGLSLSAIRFGKATRLPIEITVVDSGAGIDPDLRDHIFEPFVSSKPHGQGLGLALVRKLVRDMGGRIVHERDERAGQTIFRINLPLAAKD